MLTGVWHKAETLPWRGAVSVAWLHSLRGREQTSTWLLSWWQFCAVFQQLLVSRSFMVLWSCSVCFYAGKRRWVCHLFVGSWGYHFRLSFQSSKAGAWGKLFCKPWVRAGPMMPWEILWGEFLWPKDLSNLLGFIWALLLTCTWKKLTPSLASSSQSAEIKQTLVNGDYMVATAKSTRIASNIWDREELYSGMNFYFIRVNVGSKISGSCEPTAHQSGKWKNYRKVNWVYS